MRYPEVQDAVTHGRYESALDHYIHEGCNLLHDPCDFFVSRYYLVQAKYLDGFSLRKLPRSKQSTLLWHFLTVGLPQGKEPIEFFDSQYYLAQYSDVERHVRTGAIKIGRASCRERVCQYV